MDFHSLRVHPCICQYQIQEILEFVELMSNLPNDHEDELLDESLVDEQLLLISTSLMVNDIESAIRKFIISSLVTLCITEVSIPYCATVLFLKKISGF